MNDTLNEMKAHLKIIASMSGSKPEGWRYGGMHDLILKVGTEYVPPAYGDPGVMKECYRNAYLKMLDSSEIVYVEGYAVNTTIPVLHAWNWNSRTGETIDPTWGTGTAYLGIPFDRKYVLDTIVESERYGMIDKWEEDFPILWQKPAEFLYKDDAATRAIREITA